VASGDVLPHRSVLERARAYGAGTRRPYDFRPMFAAIRPVVSAADLAVCHLETPLSPSGRGLSGYPRFNAPPQLAVALRAAGYDACSVASNHAMDQGVRGVAGPWRSWTRPAFGMPAWLAAPGRPGPGSSPCAGCGWPC
jgi:poly-gamma-glutamate capsule biosynthesis protein CapA/YwtB (metallophosphatase superfamily)